MRASLVTLAVSGLLFALAGPALRAQDIAPDENVVLSPFEVKVQQDEGYYATSSLAGSRTDMPLKDTPSAVSVLTADFMDDLNLTNSWSAFNWSVNSDSLTYAAAEASGVQSDYNFTNFRGLGSSYGSRNYFLWYINSDSYSTERLELARGPNGVLFGDGNVGGITTVWTKRALLGTNRAILATSFDTFGGIRGTLDYNQAIGKNLAIRINYLDQSAPSWRDDAWHRTLAGHVALTWRVTPKDTIRAEAELSQDERDLYAVNYTDGASNWNRTASYNGVTAPSTTGTGVAKISTSTYNVYSPETSPNALLNYQNYYTTTGTAVVLQPGVNTGIANFPTLPSRRFNLQPKDSEARVMFKTFTVYWEHEFLRNLYFQFAYNDTINRRRTYRDETIYTNYLIDVNTVLPGGAPNPEFGQPYSEGAMTERWTNNHVSDLRGTLAYKFDSKWVNERLNLIGGSRMDRFNQVIRKLERTNGTVTAVTDATNQIYGRFYWDKPGDYEFGNVTNFNGSTYSFLPTTVTNERKSIDYEQVASTTQLLGNKVIILAGVRHDKVADGQRTTSGIPTNSVTGLPQLGAVIPNGASTTAVIGGRTEVITSNISTNEGVVISPLPWISGVFNASESFAPPTSGANKIDGTTVGIALSHGLDAGIRFNLLGDRLYLTSDFYKSTQQNRPDFSSTDTSQINQIWTDLGRNDLANLSYRDTRDVRGEGWEFEATGNPTTQLRLMANFALPRATAYNNEPGLRAYLAQNLATWEAGANNPAVAQHAQIATDITTIQSTISQNADGTALNGGFKWLSNFYATYSLTGALKGWSVGAGANVRGPCKIGNTLASPYDYIYAKAYALMSAHVSYAFKLYGLPTTVQLNGANLLNNHALNYTGTNDYTPAGGVLTRVYGGFIYFDPRKVTLTTRVTF